MAQGTDDSRFKVIPGQSLDTGIFLKYFFIVALIINISGVEPWRRCVLFECSSSSL